MDSEYEKPKLVDPIHIGITTILNEKLGNNAPTGLYIQYFHELEKIINDFFSKPIDFSCKKIDF